MSTPFALLVFLHIDSGPAKTTLHIMEQQVGVTDMWDPNEIRPYTTHAVHGTYTVYEGWCALLAGSGLTFYIVDLRATGVRPETYPGELNEMCQLTPAGLGPTFVHPPVADWK